MEIDHGNGVMTRYAHARTIKVRTGARVESGATIATVGRTGLASGPHLHFEVIVNGNSVDPLKRPVESLVSPSAALPAPADVPEVRIVIPDATGTDSARVRAASGTVETPAGTQGVGASREGGRF